MEKKKKLSAIILVAGSGKRISAYTNKPKCLLKIKKKTLLERNLIFLEKIGFTDVSLVVGFKYNIIKKEIKKYRGIIKINFIYNKRYKTHGNCYSLYLALQKSNSDIIFIDGDLIYEKRILYDFVKNRFNNSILVGNGNENDVECAKVFGENKIVKRIIEKKILKNNKYKFVGEALGINKLDYKSIFIFIKTAKNAFRLKKNLLLNWDTFYDLFLIKKLKPTYYFTNSNKWIEVDNYEDFKSAKKIKMF